MPHAAAFFSSSFSFPFSPLPSSSSTSTSTCFLGKLSVDFNPKHLLLPPFASRLKFRNQPPSLMIRSAVIEKETPETDRPDTFLRESEVGDMCGRFEKMIREAQGSVCNAIEAVDKGTKFKEDVWSRPGGGGGISRVLQDGTVWEKAGVNVSVVYGVMPSEAYRAAKAASADPKPGPIPFFAAGISSVLHPKNPFAPTMHFNYRYFETDTPKDNLYSFAMAHCIFCI